MASDLFHSGGSGQRKLNIVAPEAEGYTGSYLIKTAGAKGCLYIMPLQNTLDISPLPYSNAKELKKCRRHDALNVSQICLFSCWLCTSRSARQTCVSTSLIVNQ